MQKDFDFNAAVSTAASGDEEIDWRAPISVSQLTLITRQLIEQNIPLLWVAGEISNLTRAASGHCYFSLKDGQAQVRCVMFRHRMQYMDWSPANGMQVEVRAGATLYEARGEFQLAVEVMRHAGLGALYEAFARLKARLEREGLFAAEHKRPLPTLPSRIGVITSLKAAALRDVLITLRRRMPSARVIVYPTPVQGDGAAQRVAAAIAAASARSECEVLILCRGGGSIEDLWAFNEEVVARALHACTIPVVCGIGHETDFTIADFVADARAPTPTAAAELVSPNRMELLSRLATLHARLARSMVRRLERRMQQVDYLGRRLTHPGERILEQQRHLAHLAARLQRGAAHALIQTDLHVNALRHRLAAAVPDVAELDTRQRRLAQRLAISVERMLERHGAALSRLAAHLNALSPQLVLERGYSIVAHEDGRIVQSADELAAGDDVSLTFARGGALARVTKTRS